MMKVINNNMQKNSEDIEDYEKRIKERMVNGRLRMLFNQPFYGIVASSLEMIDTTEDRPWIDTGATDGSNLFYNRNFIDSLTDDQVIFLVAHEISHCVYEHFLRVGDRDKEYWNMAGDYKINAMLKNERIGEMIDYTITDGVKKPFKLCYDEKYNSDDWTTESIYDHLVKTKAKKRRTLDTHIEIVSDEEYEKATKKSKQDEKDGKGKVGSKKNKLIIKKSDADMMRRVMRNNIIQAAQGAGAGHIPREIAKIIRNLTESKIDWRQNLRIFVESLFKNVLSYQVPNRKSQFNDVVLPSLLRDVMVCVCICLDVSGSIVEDDHRVFLGEIQGIMDQFPSYKIQIWCFDTKVSGYDEFTSDDGRNILDFDIKGGGGTDYMCNWKFMRENEITPKQLIIFTDGEPNGEWGEPEYCETIFLIKSRNKIVAPFGETIHYE